uniref:MARVEL domain-containing protein n=1 Tax=Mycena chlorophos TaxID=658473 RepID=A0ABQ0L7V3_MYCCL|nr:predicted protein [Mycena chlorophos]
MAHDHENAAEVPSAPRRTLAQRSHKKAPSTGTGASSGRPGMHFLVTVRYLVFALFVICDAILASVAVWNGSLNVDAFLGLDVYVTLLGALGLTLTFTIIFIELIRRNAFTSRVWFELCWTGLFFTMDLAAAAALTAVGPCPHQAQESSPPSGSCASMRVLMAFSWTSTLILLSYLVLLVVLSLANRNNESIPKIWECAIHNFPPLTISIPRPHVPVVILPRFTRSDRNIDEMAQIPPPAPPTPPASPAPVVTSRRTTMSPTRPHGMRSIGLDSIYEVEHFVPPALSPIPPSDSPSISPMASPGDYHLPSPTSEESTQPAGGGVAGLYPRFIAAAAAPTHSEDQQPRKPSPSPLGDWPRSNPPLRVKRPSGAVSPTRPMGPRTRARAQTPLETLEREDV